MCWGVEGEWLNERVRLCVYVLVFKFVCVCWKNLLWDRDREQEKQSESLCGRESVCLSVCVCVFVCVLFKDTFIEGPAVSELAEQCRII